MLPLRSCIYSFKKLIIMAKKKYYILTLFVLYFFCYCSDKGKGKHIILKVSLEESSVPISDIFDSAELIPLETSEESFIRYIDKIAIEDSTYYLFDRSQFAIFIYNTKGQYLRKLSKIGQGPGEYTHLTDFIFDHSKKRMEVLSPFGILYCYDLDGNFISSHRLPSPPLNYQKLEKLNTHYIMWSHVPSQEKQISIIPEALEEISNSFYSSNRITCDFSLRDGVFNLYDENVYFYNAFSNTVYLVTPDSLKIAYEWDFGNKNINVLDKKFDDFDPKEIKDMEDRLRNSEVPFFYVKQYQNNHYYYTQQCFGYTPEGRTSLFYNKKNNKYHFFKRTKEGLFIDPIYFNDKYIISRLSYSDKEALLNSEIINNSDKDKLSDYREDDNTWLIKYLFK